MDKKEIVLQIRYNGGFDEGTFIDSWEDGDGWANESRIEQHNINGKDYYIVIDTSGCDYGIGVPGVVEVTENYDDAEVAVITVANEKE